MKKVAKNAHIEKLLLICNNLINDEKWEKADEMLDYIEKITDSYGYEIICARISLQLKKNKAKK